MVQKFGYTGPSVAHLLDITTASVNRIAKPKEMTELDR